MPPLPRHLRFARALALLSGLGACASSAPVAPQPTPRPVAAGAEHVDPCTRCVCGESTNPPSCWTTGSDHCCGSVVVEGPLLPPNLRA